MTSPSLAQSITSDEKKTLQSGFVDFGDMWNITTRLIRRTTRRVLLPVYLGKLLLLVVGVVSLILLSGVLLGQIGSAVALEVGPSTYTLDDYVPLTEALLAQGTVSETVALEPSIDEAQLTRLFEQNVGQFLTIFAVATLSLLVLSWQYSYLHLRAFQMLANSDDTRVLAAPAPVVKATFRFLLLQIFVGIVGSVLQESLGPIVGFDQSAGYAYLWQFLWFSLAGLSVYRLVFAGEGVLRSVRESYRLSIEVYWANVLRWLLFYIVVWSVLILATVLFAFVLAFLVGSAVNLIVAGSLVALALVVGVVLGLALEAFTQVFGWVSYVNITALSR